MTADNLTHDDALINAEVLVENLRTIRTDALRELDEFTVWLMRLEERVQAIKAGKEDAGNPRTFSYHHFARQASEKVDDLVYLHKGSTRAMHVRQFRDNLLEALSGEVLDETLAMLMERRSKGDNS